jgi:D-alanine--poly(phosphoribitol) ligase subunit 1
VVIGDETTPLALRGERFLTVGAETDPFSAQNSNSPAYVIFTSGSTGVPKGVVISRHAMDHYINWVIPALGLTPDARVSQHPNIGFDFSVMDIFGSLASGAQLFPIVTLKDRLFPVDAIQRLKLTHWISVPSVVDLMFRGKGAQLGDLPDLEQMVFCGEPLLPHHLDKLFRVAPSLRVMNTYGPTEATVSVTSLQLNRENWSKFSDSSIALGEAIPGMAITLAGENPNEGEIIISGPQVADGYWRDPERTANAFKGKSYRTGDWAKRIRGSLYFCERIDRQVKWLGHRIELGEIDNELQAATGNLAVTILQADGLVGVVEATDVDPSAIQRALRQKLPDYMIPARIVAIEMLPRNLNDKIDHAAIAALLQ